MERADDDSGAPLEERARAIFELAIERAPAERESFAADACGGEIGLRERVERLLRAHAAAEFGVLAPPAELGVRELFRVPREETQGGPGAESSGALEPGAAFGEFTLLRELGRGGMGVVWEARQRLPRRLVALKLLASHYRFDASAARRFLREAEAGGRLQHPGIVRVLSAGEIDGVHYIAQELVPGTRTLCDLIREQRERTETPPSYYRKVAELFAAVCDALEHAHRGGVVHRDIKPGNILLASGDTPRIADFGLAHVEDALALSRSGEFSGTPNYMSPEQAASKRAGIDHRTDVFSLGATLYEALTLRRPFDGDTSQEVICKVLFEDPPEPARLRSRIPRDLSVICMQALEKRPDARFSSMAELAADLRRHLLNEPIRARPPGALSRSVKWMRRHRVLTVAVGMAALAVLGTSAGMLRAARAQARVLRLSDTRHLEDLVVEAEALWPATLALEQDYVDWLERADELLERVGEHRTTLAGILDRALAGAAGEPPRFADPEDRWWHDQLARLIADLEALADPERGLIAGISAEFGLGVRRRLELARELEERTLAGDEARELWAEAAAAIGDRARCPAYAGLALAPQSGLLPLGPDPRTGLFEFAHLASGEPPVRDPATRELVLGEECGIVFVLLPGGRALVGAQRDDPAGPNHDPIARTDEGPVTAVELAPFFLSKYELTQGQWLRLSGANPSYCGPDFEHSSRRPTLLNPVEQITWDECREVLERRFALALPTEAQWEYGARAGQETPWSTGLDARSLEGAANVADQALEASLFGPPSWVYETWLADGYDIHAPVGTYFPNQFGLHDVHGNVWEWCRDAYCPYATPPAPGDGERSCGEPRYRIFRGGSFFYAAGIARSSYRYYYPPGFARHNLGVRPARAVEE